MKSENADRVATLGLVFVVVGTLMGAVYSVALLMGVNSFLGACATIVLAGIIIFIIAQML